MRLERVDRQPIRDSHVSRPEMCGVYDSGVNQLKSSNKTVTV
jgi:hypothetical protein